MSADTIEVPDDDDNAKAVMAEANKIVADANETVQVEAIFGLAIKVAANLKLLRSLLISEDEKLGGEHGAFPEQWADEAAKTVFHKFFQPYDAVDEDELFDRLHEHWETYHDD